MQTAGKADKHHRNQRLLPMMSWDALITGWTLKNSRLVIPHRTWNEIGNILHLSSSLCHSEYNSLRIFSYMFIARSGSAHRTCRRYTQFIFPVTLPTRNHGLRMIGGASSRGDELFSNMAWRIRFSQGQRATARVRGLYIDSPYNTWKFSCSSHWIPVYVHAQ